MIKDRSNITPIYNSFTGFTFGDYHTSQFNILRTSDGSRYNDEILAQAKDTTLTVPGMDGSLYISSQRQPKVFNLKFAYDNLGEDDVADIREWFASTKEQKLIFDERPYCYYMGKVTGTPKLSYICFDHPTDKARRVYKGEGQVTITCYYPYAKSREVDPNDYPDSAQWSMFYSSAAPSTSIDNIGQLSMPIRIMFKQKDNATYGAIGLGGISQGYPAIYFQDLDPKKVYVYDSELHLILSTDYVANQNVSTYWQQDNPDNGIVLAGDFFSVPCGQHALSTDGVEILAVDYQYIYY